jgi:ATP-dependent Lhr-like helicase
VRGYRQEWLDQLTLTGELAWGRLWGAGSSAIRATPICLLPREDLGAWLALAALKDESRSAKPRLELTHYARAILTVVEKRGACFAQDLARQAGLLPAHFEMGLAELIAHGVVTCDSFGGIRRLLTAPSRRKGTLRHAEFSPAGRWSLLRAPAPAVFDEPDAVPRRAALPGGAEQLAEFSADRLLARYGVVFRRLLERERMPIPWRDLVLVYRRRELAGQVRGGRFVQRFAGEQYALPEAIELLRRLRRKGEPARGEPLHVSAADPLNLDGILTPEPRIPAPVRRRVQVG